MSAQNNTVWPQLPVWYVHYQGPAVGQLCVKKKNVRRLLLTTISNKCYLWVMKSILYVPVKI